MKLLLSISFSFIFLFQAVMPNMDISCELQKLPKLLEHYKEHKAFDNDSFFQFLKEDYLSNQNTNEHHEDSSHKDLPFHNIHQCCHLILFYTPLQYFQLNVLEFKETNHFNDFKNNITSEYLESLFQPPQV